MEEGEGEDGTQMQKLGSCVPSLPYLCLLRVGIGGGWWLQGTGCLSVVWSSRDNNIIISQRPDMMYNIEKESV